MARREPLVRGLRSPQLFVYSIPFFFFFQGSFGGEEASSKAQVEGSDAFACSLAELGKRAMKSCFSHQVANTRHTVTCRERKNLLCCVNEDCVSL